MRVRRPIPRAADSPGVAAMRGGGLPSWRNLLLVASTFAPGGCVPDLGQHTDHKAAYLIVLLGCGVAVLLIVVLRALGGSGPKDEGGEDEEGTDAGS